MPNPIPASLRDYADEDRDIWESLQRAIALSSGFRRWQIEQQFESIEPSSNTEAQIRNYLRETLETLAY